MKLFFIGSVLAVAATTMTAHADIVYSGALNQSITQGGTPYNISITEGGTTYQWSIGWQVSGTGSSARSYSYFTPVTNGAAVSVDATDALLAVKYQYDEQINFNASWNVYPTLGSTNGNLTLTNYLTPGAPPLSPAGQFTAVGANQYAAFLFGDLDSFIDVRYGWVSFTMNGAGGFTVNDFAYNNGDIGAGVIPAPGAIALLGMVGFVGGRRRRA